MSLNYHSYLVYLLAGHCRYVPEQQAVCWTIKSFPGGKEYLMKAQFFLPSVDGNLIEGKPPINVKFEIPYFTTSGIQVAIVNPLNNLYTC